MTDSLTFEYSIDFVTTDGRDQWTSLGVTAKFEPVLDFDGKVRRAIDQASAVVTPDDHIHVWFEGYSVKVNGERRGWDHYLVMDAKDRHPELAGLSVAVADKVRSILVRLEEKGI